MTEGGRPRYRELVGINQNSWVDVVKGTVAKA